MTLEHIVKVRVSDELYNAMASAAEREEQTISATVRRVLKRVFQPDRATVELCALVDTREQYTTGQPG